MQNSRRCSQPKINTHLQEKDSFHLHKNLDAADQSLGIITNGDSVQQRQKLKRLGISEHFQVIMVSGDIGVSKPNPEIFIQACKIAKVHPTECIYIGDNLESDILACEMINMKGIWLNRKTNDSHTRTIRSLSELNTRFESEFKDVADIL